jgi:serine phosphatase RsbU (regulator of sigma subunit)/pSer/pThr/pTyr-binding forkhead associated (FHA) protein
MLNNLRLPVSSMNQTPSESGQERLVLTIQAASRRYLQPNSPTEFTVSQTCQPATIGRLDNADVRVNSEQVSRRHARIEFNGTNWSISDTSSKLGTFVNRTKIEPNQPVPVRDGDILRLGPVELAVQVEASNAGAKSARQTSLALQNLLGPAEPLQSSIIATDFSGSISVFDEHSLGGLAQHRLRLLLKSAEKFTAASSIAALAESLTEAAAKGTSAPRAILLDVSATEWKICGSYPASLGMGSELTVSRSLVRAAQQGSIAKLDCEHSGWAEAASIQALGIQSALCVPVIMDETVLGALYLDTRDAERQLTPDAAAYCLALAQLGGMAIANLHRAELAAREKAMQAELKAAREAQKNLLPAPSGIVGVIRYSLECQPGTIVAGDLFDVVPLDQDRTMVMLGDVMGKGAGAGFIMATAQTYLEARISELADLASLVKSANQYFYQRFKDSGFVTLWIGVFNRREYSVQFVDAGHGHWRKLTVGGAVEIESRGGPPLGMIEGADFECDRLELAATERLLLYSDGLVEQANVENQFFGSLDIFRKLQPACTPEQDIASLLQAHEVFRGNVELSDDLTIASIQFID